MGFKDDTLPEELQNLKEMEMLHLHNNAIAGRFPTAVSQMPRLKSLALQYNKLDGRIPDKIGTMVQLTSLGLGSNQLSGEIPRTISNLSNLRLLGLDNNDHLKGDLKSLFGGMKKLEFLYLEQNSIGGKLDYDLVTKWKEMMELDLSNNLVFGQISREILNMPNLRVLDLNTNQIDGSFPDDTLDNTVLEYLALQNNNMKGTVSDRLAFLSNLKHLGELHIANIPDRLNPVFLTFASSKICDRHFGQPVYWHPS
jgi:Leucine-rich repeat (LRR) protein